MQAGLQSEIQVMSNKSSQSNNFHSLEKPSGSIRAKLKLITSNSMNDTFANWRKNKKKTLKTQHHSETVGQITDQDNVIDKSTEKSSSTVANASEFRGMTLEQYFRVRSSSETRNHQPLSHSKDGQDCDQTKNYLKQTFEIHETDQDNYQESQKTVRTPEFNQPPVPQDLQGNDLQRRIIEKYGRKHSKLKTQSHQNAQQILLEPIRNKTRFPTMSTQDKQLIQHESTQPQTRKTRIISQSNPNSKLIDKCRPTPPQLYKYQGDFKKKQILQKVRHEKDRIHDIKINQLGFVTKYANKFNINDAICKQIIKDCRL